MQLDMHYYGVFALARAAGMKEEHARTMATASQFVDDNVKSEVIEFKDTARLSTRVSGHHAHNVKNLDLDDQRQVWVPFHFLPGAEGDSYTERLTCKKDSEVAKEMVNTYVDGMHELPFIVELIGVAAHVYADTFAHQGFSGVSSRLNLVKQDRLSYDEKLDEGMKAYVAKKIRQFAEKYGGDLILPNIKKCIPFGIRDIGNLVEAAQGIIRDGALGHAGAYTLPDRPYLEWEYYTEYPEEKHVPRNNPKDFLDGCEALYGMFVRLTDKKKDLSSGDRTDFEKIRANLDKLLRVQGSMEKRIAAWQEAAGDGKIYNNGPASIPVYDEKEWHGDREGLKHVEDSTEAIKETVFRYYQAVSFHRNYVLRTLLPKHGLVVH